MTDNEIIKALGNCTPEGSCSKCPYDRVRFESEWDCASEMVTDALDLINRQKAEIERLRLEENNLLSLINDEKSKTMSAYMLASALEVETIKWFSERLKDAFPNNNHWVRPREMVDNLVKEMTEQRKEDEKND